MLDSLHLFKTKIEDNINNQKGLCRDCPVVKKHSGPVFVNHAGSSHPQIVIISESPAGFEKIDFNFERWEELIKKILENIKNAPIRRKIEQWPTTLGDFLANLIPTSVVEESGSLVTIPTFYWTHAMKCFIQGKGETIIQAKSSLGKKFNLACECCSEYLKEEIKLIDPKLIVAIGDTAFTGLLPKKEVGKEIAFLNIDSKVVYTYHPNARQKKELKMKGFEFAKEKIEYYLIN